MLKDFFLIRVFLKHATFSFHFQKRKVCIAVFYYLYFDILICYLINNTFEIYLFSLKMNLNTEQNEQNNINNMENPYPLPVGNPYLPPYIPYYMPIYHPPYYNPGYPYNPHNPQPFNYSKAVASLKTREEEEEPKEKISKNEFKRFMKPDPFQNKTSDQIVNEFKAYTLPKLRLHRLIKLQARIKGWLVRRFVFPKKKIMHKILVDYVERKVKEIIEVFILFLLGSNYCIKNRIK